MRGVVCLLVIAHVCAAFRDAQDGAKILAPGAKDSYSIPIRSALKGEVAQVKAFDKAIDDAEFNLLSRMKTVEIPPTADSVDFYASMKHVNSANRFQVHRTKRSPQSGGLKFDGQSESNSQGSSSNHPKSINEQLPRSPSVPQSSSVNFEGKDSSLNGKGTDEENKRFFPGAFGYGSPYGHHGGGYYGNGGHHPYYPNAGFQGYPGGYYGNGVYPGGHHGGHHGGIGYPAPGYPGATGASSAAAAAASSSGGNLGFQPGGFGGSGLYGNGYYPANGYYGGGYPIINGGGGFAPGFGGFGGFRDDGGKVSAGASSTGDGKVSGGVSFE